MARKIFASKLLLIITASLVFAFSCSAAFAWGGYGGHGHYYYHGGRWYGGGWGWGWFGAGLAVGAIVSTLPPYYQLVYVNGAPYYYDGTYYYQSYPSGYVVVQPSVAPVVVAPTTATVVTTPATNFVTAPAVVQPQTSPGASVVINIPNSDGSFTAVTLSKRGNGYTGPQGEFYPGHPTVEQLNVLYGK